MYKVLNSDNEVIVVPVIDTTKHKHISGRQFTKEDGFNKIIREVPKKPISTKK